MNTTQLFIEHLIAGAFTLAGLILLILTVTGLDVSFWGIIMEKEGYATVVAFLITYPLGIFTDSFADWIFNKKNESIRVNFHLRQLNITITRYWKMPKTQPLANILLMPE